MNKPDKLAILETQDTEQRKTKTKKKHQRKLKR